MLKLYVVLRVAGVIGGVAGPVPFTLQDCDMEAKTMTREVMEKAEAKANAGDARFKTDVASWEFVCEYHAERPRLGELK